MIPGEGENDLKMWRAHYQRSFKQKWAKHIPEMSRCPGSR